jgi:hypothetical protein
MSIRPCHTSSTWASSSCTSRQLCVPDTYGSSRGFCSCKYSVWGFRDSDEMDQCEATLQTWLYFSFWVLQAIVWVGLFIKSNALLRRARTNGILARKHDILGMCTRLLVIGAIDSIVLFTLWASLCLVFDKDRAATLLLVFNAALVFGIVCTVITIALFGSTLLVTLIDSFKLTRTKQSHKHNLTIAAVTQGIIILTGITPLIYYRQLSAVGLFVAGWMLLTWALFLFIMRYISRTMERNSGELTSKHVLSLTLGTAKAILLCLSAIVSGVVAYICCDMIGRQKLDSRYLRVGTAVSLTYMFCGYTVAYTTLLVTISRMVDFRLQLRPPSISMQATPAALKAAMVSFGARSSTQQPGQNPEAQTTLDETA